MSADWFEDLREQQERQVRAMTLRELAEITMSARRQARQFSSVATLSMSKLSPMGFTARAVKRVEDAIDDIERFTEEKLDALSRS